MEVADRAVALNPNSHVGMECEGLGMRSRGALGGSNRELSDALCA